MESVADVVWVWLGKEHEGGLESCMVGKAMLRAGVI